MSGVTEAVEGIAALAIGGFLFVVLGSALSSSMESTPLIDLQFWGLIYILTALVLAVAIVYAAIQSILR